MLIAVCLILASSTSRMIRAAEPAKVWFEKQRLTDKYYCDGIGVGDIDKDGRLDIVAGPFWYSGPEFHQAHAFYPPVALKRPKALPTACFR